MASDKDKKLRKVEMDMAAGSVEESLPSGQEKKQRKKWTMEETQMLVDGCNRVRYCLFSVYTTDHTVPYDSGE